MKKRIVVLLTVVALMVVMLAMSVAPAFAAWNPATGCREGDTLFPAGTPGLQQIDGKNTEDDQVCLTHRGHEGTKIAFYDNRDLV
jgi:hypothetical protein